MHCLWHYEFFQYEVFERDHKVEEHVHIPSNAACISLEDFCRSIYIFLPVHKQKEFQDRFDKICSSQLGNGEKNVSYYEYIAFMWFIKDIQNFTDYVNEMRVVSEKNFQIYCIEFAEKNEFCK